MPNGFMQNWLWLSFDIEGTNRANHTGGAYEKVVCLVSVALMMFNFSVVALGEYFEMRTDNGEVVTLLEPGPYEGKSFKNVFHMRMYAFRPTLFQNRFRMHRVRIPYLPIFKIGIACGIRGRRVCLFLPQPNGNRGIRPPERCSYSHLMSVSLIYSRESNDN